MFSRWTENNSLVFESRSNWGHPKTLSLKVSTLSKCTNFPDEEAHDISDVGCGFVDLCPFWKQMNNGLAVEGRTKINLFDLAEEFDQHGEAVDLSAPSEEVRLIVNPVHLSRCL